LKEATMADKKTLTFAIMDVPYEDARSTTALRLMDICARRGYDINVFAYEGAVYVPFARQEAHPNAVHGHDAGEEDHPLPKEWVAAIIDEAAKNGGKVDWVNCGLCVDERGAASGSRACAAARRATFGRWPNRPTTPS
jgi:tRNA 2-thiouridine synthesizing protein D